MTTIIRLWDEHPQLSSFVILALGMLIILLFLGPARGIRCITVVGVGCSNDRSGSTMHLDHWLGCRGRSRSR